MKRQCDKLYSINAEGKYRKGETREAYITFFKCNKLVNARNMKMNDKKILCLGNISAMNGSFWSVCRKSESSSYFFYPTLFIGHRILSLLEKPCSSALQNIML